MPTKDKPSVMSLQDDLHAAICRVEALERAMTSVYEAGVSDNERFGFYQFFQDTIDSLEAVESDLREIGDAARESSGKVVNLSS